MDFLSYLKTSAVEVDEQLNKFLREWNREVEDTSPKLVHLAHAFIVACQGGKRLRGTLVKLGYELTGASRNPEILKPAAAFEIFQTAILAHDDIVDRSPLRRGKPTIYQSLGADHYAVSQTITLADIGFFLATKFISESDFPADNKNKALHTFVCAMSDTALGQMLDIELPHHPEEADPQEMLTTFRLKTAHYSLVGPLQLGEAFGGANEELLKKTEEFGENLGIAFQIQDDILGVFGDEKTIGKSVTSDVEEGKITFLYAEARKNSSLEQNEILNKYYGKGKIGFDELEQVRTVFKDTGALEYSQKKAVELVDQAKEVIKKMDVSQDKKELLIQMADFLVKREK